MKAPSVARPLIAFGNFTVVLDDTGSDSRRLYVK